MKHVRPIDPVSIWLLLNENEEDAIHYISSLLKANRNNDQHEQYWFPKPKNTGDEASYTPIQKRILRELRRLQEAEKLNPNDKKNIVASSSAALTQETQCYSSMRSKKLNQFR